MNQEAGIGVARATVLVVLSVFLLCGSAFGQNKQQQETVRILNKAEERLMQGDITALDDVKALPGDDSVAGLIMFFKGNFYRYNATPQQKAIAAKAAQYVTEVPTAGDYIKRLFKKEPGRQKSGLLINYRQTTLDALSTAKNTFAANLLFELMDESDLDVPIGDFGIALARMEVPGMPYPRDARKMASSPEGIAKWKEWWAANKDQFPVR